MDLECHEKLDSTPLKEDNISRSEDRCHEKLDTTPLKKIIYQDQNIVVVKL